MWLYQKTQKCGNTRKYTLNVRFRAILDWFYCDFENCTFLLRSLDFLELELFWQVSDCLSRNFFRDLAEPNVIIPKNTKVWKYSKIYIKCTISCHFRLILLWFWELYIPPQIFRFLGAGTFLTSLRLFVKKIFLRSRRAHRDYTNKHKSMEILEIVRKYTFQCHFRQKNSDFENCTFLLRSVDFLELELFWQVSDCLSMKIFLRSRRTHRDDRKT